MLPANKTSESVDDAALYQRCFERERRARQQAEAVLEAKSLDLYLKHEELLRVNATLEQRIAERTRELGDAVKQAERASASKSDFLARMSHEIRTPMNGVLGMLEALRITGLNDKQQQYLDIAYESAEALLALINDILDFSKIEAGRLLIESINFDLYNLLSNLLQMWQPHAHDKKLQLALQIDSEVPQWLVGDPTRLNQILTNLISNALKFTSEGKVIIQCDTLTPTGVDPVTLRFTVQDTGIGMTEEVCQRLFTAFEQADGAATSRVYGGTGLGLAICKQLAHLMDGEVSVESAVNVGSCFMLILPIGIGVAITSKPEFVAPISLSTNNIKHRILVVDDNETNRRVALAVLEHLGFDTQFACDGKEACDAIQKGNLSLVLMDCHMPVLDGFEATQFIRAWEKETDRSPIPIVAVSASAFQEDRDHCAAVGMNDFVAKPVTLTSLQTAVLRWLPTVPTESNLSATNTEDNRNNDKGNLFPEHIFDREQFLEMQLITGAQFNPLLEKFCADSMLQIQGMRSALVNDDPEALRKCAHKLKGSAGSIGAKVLSKICQRMEECARAGDIEGANEAIDTTGVCLDEVIEFIKKQIST